MYDDICIRRPRKMVYVGSLSTAPDRDGGWIREFGALGWEVIPFSSRVDIVPSLVGKFKQRFHFGFENCQMKANLLALVSNVEPEWVHFRLPIEFDRKTIDSIRASGALVTQYFNDDPFSPQRVFGLHERFRNALPAYDAHFVYRAHNVARFLNAGARHIEHCPPALDPTRFAGMTFTPNALPNYDAAFLGHFEADGRLNYMTALHEAGLKLAIHGSGWANALRQGALRHLYPAAPLFGARYGEIYARSVAGLCFFSKLNCDTWTERALEIVAVGGVLVCERTEEALGYFRDREEAFFFSSVEELLSICQRLKNDPALRRRVQQAGYARLLSGQHSLTDRANQIHQWVARKLPNNDRALVDN
jgi:hypothetical protein